MCTPILNSGIYTSLCGILAFLKKQTSHFVIGYYYLKDVNMLIEKCKYNTQMLQKCGRMIKR